MVTYCAGLWKGSSERSWSLVYRQRVGGSRHAPCYRYHTILAIFILHVQPAKRSYELGNRDPYRHVSALGRLFESLPQLRRQQHHLPGRSIHRSPRLDRLPSLPPPKYSTHLPQAEKSREALFSTNSSGQLEHFTSDGWLSPVVNPDSFGDEGSDSPEGEAFVLDLESAWTDWVNDGSKGANGALARLGVGYADGLIVIGVMSVLMLNLV